MHQRRELGEFLRARRARLHPEELGLASGPRRRVAGLRRDEAARRAGVSVEYYTRLEQGRGGRPSDGVLDALAVALELGPAARDHLLRLAAPRSRPAPHQVSHSGPPVAGDRLRPSVRALLDAIGATPVVAYARNLDVLAMNPLAIALYAGFAGWPSDRANCARALFLNPASHDWYIDWDEVAHDVVGLLRRSVGEHPDDPGLRALVDELAAGSDAFGRLWVTHEVRQDLHGRKRLRHPTLGELDIDFEQLLVPGDDGVVLMAYTAPPGTPTRAALDHLTDTAATAATAALPG
jgi:transcriptional regulator with XRE-family HTH domain